MTINRVMPVLTVDDIDAVRGFYTDVLGLREVMNHGWIATFADENNDNQISLMTRDLTAVVNPEVSIEVDDVDAAHGAAMEAGVQIVHELCDEEWGVRRFFARDAAGHIVNVLTHRA